MNNQNETTLNQNFNSEFNVKKIVKIHHQYPPFSHDLLLLINKCKIEITNEQMDIIDTITTFNINARYDDYKLAFYKKCTFEYTTIWINHIKNIRQWIIDTQLT